MKSNQNNPIDFVLPWVDGGDPRWVSEKNRYSEKIIEDVNGDCRYRDWDNLRYWFRGVEKFAPWVNKIHFVTCGQIPDWLNVDEPKLNLVNHSDYIPAEYLPTFSSHPIELNLHRIEGISEQFVYFNDDLFLLRPVKPEDYFIGGKPCDEADFDYLCSTHGDVFPHILLNDNAILNRNFDKSQVIKANFSKWFSLKHNAGTLLRSLLLLPFKNFTGIKWFHDPSPFLKSTFETIWEKEYPVLHETCLRKFRDHLDVNQYAVRNWQLAEGNFVPKNIQKVTKAFSVENNNEKLYDAIVKQKFQSVCLNDSDKCTNFDEVRENVKRRLESVLPEKSSFEI